MTLPATQPQGAIAPASNGYLIPRPQMGGVWTTLQLDTEEQRIAAINTVTGRGIEADEVLGKEILIQDLFTKGIELTNAKTGEIGPAILILLIPPEGRPVQSTSGVILGTLEAIASMLGRPPWIPAIRCIIRQERIEGGKKIMHRLEILGRVQG